MLNNRCVCEIILTEREMSVENEPLSREEELSWRIHFGKQHLQSADTAIKTAKDRMFATEQV